MQRRGTRHVDRGSGTREKKLNGKLPIIVVGPHNQSDLHEADYHLESFDPRQLLNVLQAVAPERVSAIEQHEDEMRDDETGG